MKLYRVLIGIFALFVFCYGCSGGGGDDGGSRTNPSPTSTLITTTTTLNPSPASTLPSTIATTTTTTKATTTTVITPAPTLPPQTSTSIIPVTTTTIQIPVTTTTVPAPATTVPAPPATVPGPTPTIPTPTTIPAPATTIPIATTIPPTTSTTVLTTTTTVQNPITTTTIAPAVTTSVASTTTTTPETTTTTAAPTSTTAAPTTTTVLITTTTTTTSISTTTTTAITDSFTLFAEDYQNSLNRGDVNLLMSRVSRSYMHNGQDYTCFHDTWQWRFSHYTYQNAQYSITNLNIQGQTAAVTAIVSYTIFGSYTSSSINDTFILEDDKWKLYGNQSANSAPTVTEMYSFDGSNGYPASNFSTSDATQGVGVKIVIDNAKNNTFLSVLFYQPNGAQYGDTRTFNIVLTDNYPDCTRFPLSWDPGPSISIFNDPEYYGTWRAVLLFNGVKIGEIQFEFRPQRT